MKIQWRTEPDEPANDLFRQAHLEKTQRLTPLVFYRVEISRLWLVYNIQRGATQTKFLKNEKLSRDLIFFAQLRTLLASNGGKLTPADGFIDTVAAMDRW